MRILIIRGGAVGDFIVTLPAIGMLRKAWPDAFIEIMCRTPVLSLAVGRYYADQGRSIEDPLLAPFYVANAVLPEKAAAYFASFDLIVSYLPDPDGVFHGNLVRCGFEQGGNSTGRPVMGRGGKKYLLRGDSQNFTRPAAAGLCQPLAWLGLQAVSYASRVYPSVEDRAAAGEIMGVGEGMTVVIHPGSGSAKKNWPLANWVKVCSYLVEKRNARLYLVGGEAEADLLPEMSTRMSFPHRLIHDCPLSICAAVLERCDLFLGHDSGISHLAAAVGANCLLLFGPSDPEIWAPPGKKVKVIRGGVFMDAISLSAVREEIDAFL